MPVQPQCGGETKIGQSSSAQHSWVCLCAPRGAQGTGLKQVCTVEAGVDAWISTHVFKAIKCLTECGSIIHVDKVRWSPQEPLGVLLKWRKNLSTGGGYHLALDPFDNGA